MIGRLHSSSLASVVMYTRPVTALEFSGGVLGKMSTLVVFVLAYVGAPARPEHA